MKKHLSIYIILFVIVVLLMVYFWTNRIDSQNKAFLESSIKCSQDGQKFFDKYQTKTDNFTLYNKVYSAGYIFSEPTYYFNRDINSCLVLISYKGSTHESMGRTVYDINHSEIVDIYTNKILSSTDNPNNDMDYIKQLNTLINKK